MVYIMTTPLNSYQTCVFQPQIVNPLNPSRVSGLEPSAPPYELICQDEASFNGFHGPQANLHPLPSTIRDFLPGDPSSHIQIHEFEPGFSYHHQGTSITYPVASAAAAAAIPLDLARKKVGSFDQYPIYEIIPEAKQYVVYESQKFTRHLIAMPYHGFHTLRSIQSIAIGALSLIGGGLAAKIAISFAATTTVTVACVGIATLSILGAGLYAVWNLNESDPEAQKELRQKALANQTIENNHFTTPKEKRSFLFSKNYASVKVLADDLRVLKSLQLLTSQENAFFQNHILPLEALFDQLNDEYSSKIKPIKTRMQQQQQQAHNDYNFSSAVQTDHAIERSYRLARQKEENYQSSDAIIDTAYITAKTMNASSLKREARQRDCKIAIATEQYHFEDSKIKKEINFDERMDAIFKCNQHNLNVFRQFFSEQSLCCSDSNIDNYDTTSYLLA